MKKINKRVSLILSSAVLALGIISVPVLAGTNTEVANQANSAPVAAASRNIQSVGDATVNNYMNNEAMLNMHNSKVMQDAMKSGDFDKMREAMNSPEIKAQLGEEVVGAMNKMMSNGNISSMHRGNMMGSGNTMMNW
ncbi:hypothetical protein Desdi_1099 [Desulfitobacterium dichloroeliminans LMG P-21439]|uniref:Uncharacterized protein n=1 Tax=Desulfitobacterium dichloroeliminans (strain LMG P-21439 / DCA1) TaxID=871963 RepID=L0F7J6_DESDL|nr:hypothetical protein [Desulfitobacterium dichloroeliminans]AGA68616.1 hypothetical protein Desdi_1099 [Desulfitobacterium dichloroeliminans LMG P-21439]